MNTQLSIEQLKLTTEYQEFVKTVNNRPFDGHHDYYMDTENFALSKWDNKTYPIVEHYKSERWYAHVRELLDTAGFRYSHTIPYKNMESIMLDIALERYKSWVLLGLSEEWFYN
jgi:hypothetical protein